MHTAPYATNGRTRTWTYTWHANGELASIDGPRTDVTDVISFALDSAGFVSTTTNALGHVGEVVSRDGAGRITRIRDPNAVETSFVYDDRGRLASMTRHGHPAGDSVTTYTYDLAGNVASVSEPLRSPIGYTYDGASRLIRITNADNERIEITRDLLGNVTAQETYTTANVLTHRWTATFDELGRPLTHAGSAGQTTGFAYDTNSNLTQVTDPRSGVTTHLYDLHDRLKQSTDALLGVAGQSYDARDNLTVATDPKAVATTRTVDGFDHVIREVSPDIGTTDYEYDAAGNLTRLTDARGKVTEFSYDALNRVTAKLFPADTPRNQAFTWDDATSGYNGLGRLATASDVAGATAFKYNAYGQVARERRVQGGHTYDTIYDWDRDGSLFDLTLPSGRRIEYRRDGYGRISVVRLKETPSSTSIDLATSIAYRPFGPLASLTHGNSLGLQLGFTQDYLEASRMVGGGAVQSLTHTYDASGNMITRSDVLTSARSETFGYDALDRLTSAGGLYGSISYSLDANANRTSRTIGSVTETYTYAAGTNRLTGVTSSAGTRSFAQLASGHTASDDRGGGDVLLYAYDDEGRLTGITRQGSPTASYAYDFRGRRVQRTLIGTPNTVRLAIHRPDGRLLAEHDESTGAVLSETVRLDDGTPLALIIGPQGTPTVRQIHPDRLGTPRLMTDGAGAVVWDAVYQPFGELQAMTGAGPEERFPGQHFDAESGLHQNHYRTYDPSTGRYIEPDPIGLDGGWNRFAYVEGNPVRFTDSHGQAVDGFVDLAFIAYDLALLYCGHGDRTTNLAALAADIVAAAIPGITGAGAALRAANVKSLAKSASEKLPVMKGMGAAERAKVLSAAGFKQTKVSKSPGRNETWKHADGSDVRVHPYGNVNASPHSSGNNAHLHKQDPAGNQLNDRGHASATPNDTHIGLPNPVDLPVVRGRPHGW